MALTRHAASPSGGATQHQSPLLPGPPPGTGKLPLLFPSLSLKLPPVCPSGPGPLPFRGSPVVPNSGAHPLASATHRPHSTVQWALPPCCDPLEGRDAVLSTSTCWVLADLQVTPGPAAEKQGIWGLLMRHPGQRRLSLPGSLCLVGVNSSPAAGRLCLMVNPHSPPEHPVAGSAQPAGVGCALEMQPPASGVPGVHSSSPSSSQSPGSLQVWTQCPFSAFGSSPLPKASLASLRSPKSGTIQAAAAAFLGETRSQPLLAPATAAQG